MRALTAQGPAVSMLGFGASPLGNVFGEISGTQAEQAVHEAINQGINFFDTSPYYGSTLSEQRLGQALRGCRERVVLATKCGRYGAEVFDFRAATVERSVNDSLRRLKTDYVDLFQVHDCEFTTVQQILGETLPAMQRCREDGKARFIGITGYQLGNLLHIAKGAQVQGLRIDCILSYCRYNLANTSLRAVLTSYAAQRGIGLINASPLHMGMLTQAGAPAWHPAASRCRLACAAAARLCAEHGVALEEIALQFCLDYEGVATTLVGMGMPALVKANLRALAAPRRPELTARIRSLLAEAGAEELWSSGLRENWDPETPSGADLQETSR